MVVKSDEEWLQIVDRFDVPLEDTIEVERLKAALSKKLEGASGAPELTPEFLSGFQRGAELKYERLPALGIQTTPIYRDIRGRFASAREAARRDEFGNIMPMAAAGAYSVQLGFQWKVTKRIISPAEVAELLAR